MCMCLYIHTSQNGQKYEKNSSLTIDKCKIEYIMITLYTYQTGKIIIQLLLVVVVSRSIMFDSLRPHVL